MDISGSDILHPSVTQAAVAGASSPRRGLLPRVPRVGPPPRPATTSADAGYATLADGTVIHLRMLEAADSEAILTFFAGLSPQSMRLRFHQPRRSLSPALARLLCSMDGNDHVAVGAFTGEELIGTARFVRSDDTPNAADIAFSVADRYQGLGAGRLLLRHLALAAGQRGVENFTFTVLAENTAALRLVAGPNAALSLRSAQREGRIPVAHLLTRS